MKPSHLFYVASAAFLLATVFSVANHSDFWFVWLSLATLFFILGKGRNDQ